jgi:hypothetical protein
MAADTLNRINKLCRERSELYRGNGRCRLRGSALRARVAAIDGELRMLWERRRRERVGRLEGIDLLIHRVYEGLYGPSYDAVPIPVCEEGTAAGQAA